MTSYYYNNNNVIVKKKVLYKILYILYNIKKNGTFH